MHTRIRVLTVAMMAMASACATESTSSVDQPALCPPVACSSCPLGYYGPDDVPADATLAHITSNDPRANVTVWFRVGTSETSTTAPTLPADIAIPSGTERLLATTSHGSVQVAYDGCN